MPQAIDGLRRLQNESTSVERCLIEKLKPGLRCIADQAFLFVESSQARCCGKVAELKQWLLAAHVIMVFSQ